MKFCISIILLTTLNLFSQKNCNFIILDETNNNAIMFAAINIENNSYYADSIGTFSVESLEKIKELKISCIGYETKILKTNLKCGEKIYLKPRDILLPEFDVKYKKGKIRKIGLSKKSSTTLSMSSGNIMSTFIPNETQTTKIIRKIILPFKTEGQILSSFRLHLYSCNPDKSPLKDLFEQNIVVNPDKKKGVIEYQIQKFDIEMPKEGVFVGVEWLRSASDAKLKTNDVKVFLSKNKKGGYKTWELSQRTKSLWMPINSIGGSSSFIMNIGLEIEER